MAQSNNQNIRAFFVLPPANAEVVPMQYRAADSLPAHTTGDADVDTVLHLRDMVRTGDPVMIENALSMFAAIKRPRAEMEDAYRTYMYSRNPGNVFAGFDATCFCDLDAEAKKVSEKVALCAEAYARFGDERLSNHDAVKFCEKALSGVDCGSWQGNDEDVDRVFGEITDMVPATLDDILFEMTFWDRMYAMNNAVCGGDLPDAHRCRYWYLFRRIPKTPAASREEALRLFDYMYEAQTLSVDERGGQREVIRSLIAGC